MQHDHLLIATLIDLDEHVSNIDEVELEVITSLSQGKPLPVDNAKQTAAPKPVHFNDILKGG